jgi:hypothetical protein
MLAHFKVMGILGERKHKAARAARKQNRSRRKRRWSKTKKWTVAATTLIVAVVGLVGSTVGMYWYASPKVMVNVSELLNPVEPFSAPFTISNNGNFAIHHVTFRCVVLHAGDDFNTHIVMPPGSPGAASSDAIVPELNPGETSTVGCPFPFFFEHPVTHADVEIFVKYKPEWQPWHQEKPFRFAITRDSQGHLRWMSRAMSE